MERSFLLQGKDRYLTAWEMNANVLSCEDQLTCFILFSGLCSCMNICTLEKQQQQQEKPPYILALLIFGSLMRTSI